MKRARILVFLLLQFVCSECSARYDFSFLRQHDRVLALARGGQRSEPYELNPNYIPPPSSPNQPMTLGDLEQKHTYAVEANQNTNTSPVEQVTSFMIQLNKTSPTLSISSVVCIILWLCWQQPQYLRWLQTNFVCSRYNLRQGRLYTTLTSAFSHASLTHLLVNLVAFLSFGPSLAQTLSKSGWKLWPLVVGSALTASYFFLLMSKGSGGCMGLSGVTLAFLALTARIYPNRELGVLLMGIIPVRMPAKVALPALLFLSLVGAVANKGKICHAAHLGGLVFGMAYYELWMRRNMLSRIKRIILSR